ncbi:MAG: aldo/keto reductase [Actinomycetales bacterium]|nr:aldo/keto reductase [Actinomycetales bacterium]
MRTRILGSGSAALEVSTLGLGCMGMSFAYGVADEEQSLATAEHALDLGVTFLDTSDSYGPYANEELLARVLRRRRNEVVLATKFGQRFHEDGRRTIDGSPEYVRQACEASLRRLGIDSIDLYYQHRIDRTVPIEETWGALSDLVSDGKVRFLGLSEASPESIERAHAVHPVTALQTEWSLWTRDVESDGVLATVRRLGIGFVAYSPLGRGFLTGTIQSKEDFADDDGRRAWPRFQDDAIEANRHIVDAVRTVAESLGTTPAQVALAWVLSRGEDVVPIPGSRKVAHLEDNVAATSIVLTAEQQAALDQAAPVGATVGTRYPEALMGALRA